METTKREIVIQADGLSKRYKEITAVADISFQVQRGEVFGLLGPNGAGKTTAISMMLGLIRPTTGSVAIAGQNVQMQSTAALRNVGAMVEAAFYPYLSGWDNLWVLAQMSGGDQTREQMTGILEQVGLVDRADSRVNTYSMGMKQRLGLAAALIHDPEILILDEPTNGLDPAGMLEMRQLIQRLAQTEGKTIILSSHLLHEVEQVCDRVMILNKGHMIANGRVADLLAQGGHVEIRIVEVQEAMAILKTLDWVVGVELRDDVIYVDAPSERAAELTAVLAQNHLYLHGLKATERSLENYFLSVTGDS
ncbi:MAG: ABC transporter ATP-binding protein [Chloroflexi bacterium]|nr:ABC transporter ATP-binding protein [Chloroflexota bacterium]